MLGNDNGDYDDDSDNDNDNNFSVVVGGPIRQKRRAVLRWNRKRVNDNSNNNNNNNNGYNNYGDHDDDNGDSGGDYNNSEENTVVFGKAEKEKESAQEVVLYIVKEKK
ncbi:hypothetical protein F8M41_012325 [Gigaspora margarita]|uniref:Uncharacterized protein n=1 Tax=Gigaspora margarita TaxID=4874 RepID=A0A8H3WZ30_GIGMA|nr:hypothetical protein F8M41_012325 [Gigaspora margarita]